MEIQDSLDSSVSEEPTQELVHDDSNQVDKVSVDELLEMGRKGVQITEANSSNENHTKNTEETIMETRDEDQDAIVAGNRRFVHEGKIN